MINMKIKSYFFIFLIIFMSFQGKANNSDNVIINGNKNIDNSVIFSIIDEYLDPINNDNLNLIVKKLEGTGNFKSINIYISDDILYIDLEENIKIRNINFSGNKRFKKEDLFNIINELNLLNYYNENQIFSFIDELKKLYLSFGYNQFEINYESILLNDNKFVDLNFNIIEGKISKINRIFFQGNKNFDKNTLIEKIKSRERNFFRFFINSNFKSYVAQNDIIRLNQFYLENGYKNISIKLNTEYIYNKNKFNLYFNIREGEKFNFNEFNIDINKLDLTINQKENLNLIVTKYVDKKIKNNTNYNRSHTDNISDQLTDYLFANGLMFFDIDVLEKNTNTNVDVLFKISSIQPKYVNKINIIGNIRTKDKVIRREIEFGEGDAFNSNLINQSIKNINRLDILNNVKINESPLSENLIDLDLLVNEKPTGDFQVGLSAGTLKGATFITGLREKNIGGSGRTLNLSVNTSSKNTEYLLNVVEPYILNKNLSLTYGFSYQEKDLSTSSSYKTNTINSNIGFNYDLSKNLYHSISLNYELKDYIITNSSNVATSILNSAGNNAKIILNNILTYNNLNSFLRPTNGDYVSYFNSISPSNNDKNGYIKNIITYKKYYSIKKKHVFSINSKIGNISSYSGNTIMTDENFSLGGRWLRGFDSFGAGPRDSITSYIGGQNILVSKFDYIFPLNSNSDNPIDINFFTDLGKVWSNKVSPTNNKESIRSSYGFGSKFYTPIGPISLSWAFPLQDESYDIKRMFLFSIGN